MKKISFLMLFLTILSSLYADKKSMDDLFNEKKNSFNKTMDDKIKGYDLERDKRDREFNRRLRESWELFSTKKEAWGLGPKPEVLPEAKVIDFKESDEPEVVILPTKKPVIKAEPKTPKIEEVDFKERTKRINFNFFGDRLKITYPKEIANVRLTTVDDRNISDAWERCSETEYAPLVNQIKNYENSYKLNPWGTYKLVNSISKKIFRERASRVLFNGFILTQLGIPSKIAHSSNRAYLLLPSNKPLYSKPYLTIKGTKYYIITPVDGKLNKIKTYTADFPGVPREFDLTIKRLPILKEEEGYKRLSFEYGGITHSINVTYNKTLVDFFEDYPQTHYENYFNTDLYHKSRESIIKGLKPLIKGKSEAEAVNILLHFVQKSFDYQTDQEQFNREKPLFPEETLHYKYSDCEDRSVLFTYLVKEMLGLDVVGLKYPGHMSTGVLLKSKDGDIVKVGSKSYTIADPTFINANIGMAMPSYKNSEPEIIGIE